MPTLSWPFKSSSEFIEFAKSYDNQEILNMECAVLEFQTNSRKESYLKPRWSGKTTYTVRQALAEALSDEFGDTYRRAQIDNEGGCTFTIWLKTR